MLPKRRVASLLLLLTGLLLVIPEAGGAGEITRLRMMRFGGTVETSDNVFLVSGSVGPSSFFKNLHSINSPEGTILLDDIGEVQFFPERMTITINFIGPVPIKRKGTPSRDSALELIQGLTFKAQWKRGMKLRPVKDFRLLAASETKFPNLDPLRNPQGRFTNGWSFEFVLEDNEVPVSDHLILYVFSSENKLLARLSAYL